MLSAIGPKQTHFKRFNKCYYNKARLVKIHTFINNNLIQGQKQSTLK